MGKFLKYDTAHDIVHSYYGGTSANCPLCNGKAEKTEAEEMAGECISNRMAMNRGPMLQTMGAELDTKTRNNLEDSSFAYIDSKGGRHLPIHDAAHVRNALARFNQTQFESEAKKKEALSKIHSAAKKLGVDVSDNKKSTEAHIYIDVMKFAEDGKLPKEIQLIPIGKWNTSQYGPIEVTEDDLKEMVKNFNEKVRKAVPIDVDHENKKAAGWIHKLEVRANGLWSVDTEWTKFGEELITGGMYKFLSPEFSQTYVDPENNDLILNNVLIAASLVNFPLFKELKPLRAHEGEYLTKEENGFMLYISLPKLEKLENSKTMQLSEILKKDTISAEEKDFLKVHASELTDEQKKKYGIAEADDSHKTTKTGDEPTLVKISASELETLKSQAQAGAIAAKELETTKMKEELSTLLFKDKHIKFKAGEIDKVIGFAMTLNKDQKVAFKEILGMLPDIKLFGEIGSAENGFGKAPKGKDKRTVAGNELDTLVKARMNEKKEDYVTALKAVQTEHPEVTNYTE